MEGGKSLGPYAQLVVQFPMPVAFELLDFRFLSVLKPHYLSHRFRPRSPIPVEIVFLRVYETHAHVNFVTSPQVCEEEKRPPNLVVAGGQHGRHVREAGVLTAGITSSQFETWCTPR